MGKISENQQKNVRFTFKKEERLCSKKLFDKLFTDGSSFLVYPMKIVFIETGFEGKYPVKAAFSVRKKLFRKAVRRNLIKRRMREAYRCNKHLLYSRLGHEKKIALIFIYVGKDIAEYKVIEAGVKKALNRIIKRLPE
jgi:ribonuclease P protein component